MPSIFLAEIHAVQWINGLCDAVRMTRAKRMSKAWRLSVNGITGLGNPMYLVAYHHQEIRQSHCYLRIAKAILSAQFEGRRFLSLPCLAFSSCAFSIVLLFCLDFRV